MRTKELATEPIEGPALPLQRVHHVHGGDSLPLGVLGVGDSVPDHVLQEHLQAASPGKAADSRLRDALNVITQHLPVSLGSSLSKSLAAFATSRHLGNEEFGD